MNKVFSIDQPIRLPDGTLLSEIVGPATFNRRQIKATSDVSLALGTIEKLSASEIHLHPIVSQVTFVLSGNLAVKMKGLQDALPYKIEVKPRESVLTLPGTFFQLINESAGDCEALYIVGPAFAFETDKEGNVLYNDAVIFGKDWDELARQNYPAPNSAEIELLTKARAMSVARLAGKANLP